MAVAIEYLGPSDEVYIPSAGAACARGASVEVPDDVAGSEPAGTDPGSGLLAQVDTWRRKRTAPVTPAKSAPAATATATED